jgi:Ferredoxin
MKAKLAERGLKGRVRANKSGCLDQCEHGPNMVVYPEAVWYGGVRKEDLDEIVDSHITGGEPVRRLMIAESCLNAATCPHKPRKASTSG